MRRTVRAILAGGALAMATLMGAGGAGGALAAVPAYETQGVTAVWGLRAGVSRGLVAVTQDGPTLTLAFHLHGLKPNRGYQLVASSRGCRSTGGALFGRVVRTNGKGVIWDPVRIAADASRIVSFRVKDRVAHTTVMCSAGVAFPLSPAVDVTKMRGQGAWRGLVGISETGPTWEIYASFSGLRPGRTYHLIAQDDACEPGGMVLYTKSFTASAKGTLLRRFDIAAAGPGAAATITVDSLRLATDSGALLACTILA